MHSAAFTDDRLRKHVIVLSVKADSAVKSTADLNARVVTRFVCLNVFPALTGQRPPLRSGRRSKVFAK